MRERREREREESIAIERRDERGANLKRELNSIFRFDENSQKPSEYGGVKQATNWSAPGMLQ